jgi:hypothetical protein
LLDDGKEAAMVAGVDEDDDGDPWEAPEDVDLLTLFHGGPRGLLLFPGLLVRVLVLLLPQPPPPPPPPASFSIPNSTLAELLVLSVELVVL